MNFPESNETGSDNYSDPMSPSVEGDEVEPVEPEPIPPETAPDAASMPPEEPDDERGKEEDGPDGPDRTAPVSELVEAKSIADRDFWDSRSVRVSRGEIAMLNEEDFKTCAGRGWVKGA